MFIVAENTGSVNIYFWKNLAFALTFEPKGITKLGRGYKSR